ncbi:cytochrome P450 [Zychaea mexicana]|uniref:cytochrome P450 n=1 Tax=Zychaea mexicana TaxID=64656 RepID=UPI0022FE78EB|nr:cytochrome P450 [Zychaea mexicana]KAI9485028.1 cytochrome P450 [Zychaea mexicana]
MENILSVYQSHVLPLLSKGSKKNKVSISVAVAVLVLYLAYDKVAKPPRNLRHIPQASFFGYLNAFIKKVPIADVAEKYTLPAALQSEHGLYVRFDNNGWSVRINNPAIAKKFLLGTDIFPKASVSADREGTLYGKFAVGPNVAFINGQHWKSQRMVMNPAFHRQMPIDLFGKLTLKLFNVMDESLDKPINFPDMTTRWTLDAIGLAGFDFDFNAIRDHDNVWVQRYKAIMTGSINPLYLVFPVIDRKLLFLLPKRRRLHEELDEFLKMIRTMISDKRQLLKEKKASNIIDREKDLLTLMIEAENEGNGTLTDEELRSNLCIFILAGHDTTANALAYIAYYLAIHPDIQQKVREEATRVLGDQPVDAVPTIEQSRQLPYLDMVIKETLRICGPAASMVVRTATEDTELGGVFIPKGTRVSVDIFESHRNPRVWNSPLTFDPERFAPGGEAEKLSKQGMPWLAFSNGARQCIGMNFSMAEQRVLLPMLLRKYEISLPEDSIHKKKLITNGLIILSPKDLYFNFKRLY